MCKLTMRLYQPFQTLASSPIGSEYGLKISRSLYNVGLKDWNWLSYIIKGPT